MSGGSLILRLDIGNETFQRTFLKLPANIQAQAKKIVGELFLMDTSKAPAKLHFHHLVNKAVKSAVDSNKTVKVYTIHITPDDKYKASFTLEGGTAYFRVCGEHDWVDKNP